MQQLVKKGALMILTICWNASALERTSADCLCSPVWVGPQTTCGCRSAVSLSLLSSHNIFVR